MRPRAGEGSGTLVLFTVCAQAAVGLVVVGSVADFRRGGAVPLGVAFALLGVAGLAALFHLGRPRPALRAMQNLRRSPLSREILAGLLFALLLLADLVTSSGDTDGLRRSLVLLSGGVFVLTMAQVYRIRTVPAWDTFATTGAFFSTALVLGLAGGLLLGTCVDEMPDVRALAFVAAAAMVVELLVAKAHLGVLERQGGVAAASARVVRVHFRGVWGMRAATALLGAGVLLAVAVTAEGASWRCAGSLLAVLLLFASELLGRWLFYAFHRRVGL